MKFPKIKIGTRGTMVLLGVGGALSAVADYIFARNDARKEFDAEREVYEKKLREIMGPESEESEKTSEEVENEEVTE